MREPILRVQSGLTGRDLVLLGWLADHGVLTTEQISAALFPSVNFTQRRLRVLREQREVIDRFRPQRADGGSFPYHWLLTQLGADTIAMQRDEPVPRRDLARARRWQLTNRANLPHLLGVNGFFTALAAHARTHPGAHLVRWWSAARCQQLGAFADPTGPVDGTVLAYRMTVRPDGHGVFTEDGRSTAFFLEYDTGTETLARLVDKVGGYRQLARVTGNVWPVLFWLPTAARERHLHAALTEARVGYPVATAVHGRPGGRLTPASGPPAVPDGPAGQVWWLHRHNGPTLPLAALGAAVAADLREAA
ncbi:replication-relaxation family protein [Paractinoplanes rishiriensis]|uniref:replication-relaxation family protein n=1 Tax=Paractinoplanes rishiriensis TaxID=1050105 RepID=UPI001940D9BC|nr:replication-relaxation family protein [Actinoplanes rishiriensis]